MIYGSVCSGIEAATVAWHPLGWRPAFFAEIEAFPSAVLKHHYPDVPNVGDFTRLIDAAAPVPSIHVLVGGTPCQSFSVAGLRRGLADARGGLTLEFVRLAQRLRPKWIVWENVPGVLSQDGGRAFGAFLGALGELGYGWAYRVLDAQYFGVAQRRRRVFVVGHSGGDFARAAAVLFEPEGVQRHSPPSREAGQRAAPTLAARTRGGGGLGTDFDLDGGLIRHDGGRGVATQADVAGPLDSHYYKGPGSRQGGEREYVAHVVAPSVFPIDLRQAARGERNTNDRLTGGAPGTGIGEEGDPAYTVSERQQGVAHVVAPPRATFWNGSDLAETLTATSDDQRMPDKGRMQMVVQPMDSAHNGGGLNGQDAYTGRVLPVVQCVTGERTHALKAEGADGSEDGTGRGTPIVTSIGFYPTEGRDFPAFNELSPTVKVGSGGTSGNPPGVMSAMAVDTYNGTITGDVAVPLSTMGGAGNTGPSAMVNMAVRRLTPIECERLQGFPDDYTRIEWKNKPASECPDGPRYKALGNSMAVPVMRWIGERIAKVEAA